MGLTCMVCAAWFTLHTGSWHSQPQFSNDTYGAGVEVDMTEDVRLLTGGYRNSYRGGTAYLGGAWLPVGDRLKFGGFAAYASGYRAHLGLDALAGGMVEWTPYESFRITVVGLPPVAPHLGGAVSLMLQFRIE
jgi:hypothetical protein